jgi:hypothetical protein
MSEWRDIGSAPKDGTVILFANYDAMCLLTGAPHVWTGRYIDVDGESRMFECSYAATNENGEPTHWQPLPEPPA